MQEHEEWRPGQVIAKRYRLDAPLGRGGMAAVWRAEHLTLSSSVAIKLVPREHGANDEARARFLLEAQAAAALRGTHVVQILDYGLHHDVVPYIVMELLEGETLAQRLERQRGRLPPSQVYRILTHVARAVSKAHAIGIIHRDLKPENIFLAKNDDEEIAKVLDFGIAKITKQVPLLSDTGAGTMLGTPSYMSPEQVHGNRPVDCRTDIWSMGVIAFECVCGRLPFPATARGELVLQICSDPLPIGSDIADVLTEFDRWFERAANRDPDRRFQSAKELVEAFAAVFVPGKGPWEPKLSGAPIEELVESDGWAGVVEVQQRLSLDAAAAPIPLSPEDRSDTGPPASVREIPTAPPRRDPVTRSLVLRAAAASFLGCAVIAAIAVPFGRSRPRAPAATPEMARASARSASPQPSPSAEPPPPVSAAPALQEPPPSMLARPLPTSRTRAPALAAPPPTSASSTSPVVPKKKDGI